MRKIFKQWFRNYNEFLKGDRNVIIILGSLILLIFTWVVIINHIHPKSKYNYAEYEQLLKELEAPKDNINRSSKSLFIFDPNTISSEMLDSLDLPVFVKRNIMNYRNSGGLFSSPGEIRKIYGMNDSIFDVIKYYISISEKKELFESTPKAERKISGWIDPNTADFNQLIEFGLNQFQANNLIEFRNKGGTFRSQSDMRKIYGIDSSFYKLIENNIRIEAKEDLTVRNDNTIFLKVELNNADSTDLMKLIGIGSVYASRILKYRDLLGGFYSTSQLLEVYNFSEETYRKIENSISADTLLLKKIRINFVEYVDLLRHPYLNKKQVEAVLNYRDQKGAFKNIQQLKTSGLVDSETFYRISPYLTCR